MKFREQIREDSFEFAQELANGEIDIIKFVSELYRGNIFVMFKGTRDVYSGNNNFPINVDNKIATFSNLPGSKFKKYILGSLCKHNHDFEGTGKSLRYNKKSNGCVFCANKLNSNIDQTISRVNEHPTNYEEHPTKINKDRDTIVFLADVLAGYKGDSLYNAERDIEKLAVFKTQCKNYHNVEGTGFTLRYKIGGGCIHCDVEEDLSSQVREKVKRMKNKKKEKMGFDKEAVKVVEEGIADKRPTVRERFGNVFKKKLK